MKRNTSPHPSVPISRILENAVILVLVTFLLGMASIYGSTIHFSDSGPSAGTTASRTNTEVLQSLQQSFIRPYVEAWKKIASRISSQEFCTGTGTFFNACYYPGKVSIIQ